MESLAASHPPEAHQHLSTSKVQPGLGAATQLCYTAASHHHLAEIRVSISKPAGLQSKRLYTTPDQVKPPTQIKEALPAHPHRIYKKNLQILLPVSSSKSGARISLSEKKILERASRSESCHLSAGCSRNFPSMTAFRPSLPKKGSSGTVAQLMHRSSRNLTSPIGCRQLQFIPSTRGFTAASDRHLNGAALGEQQETQGR